MQTGVRWEHPALKQLVVEASRALAQLDADRLEELAQSCQALNRDLADRTPEERILLAMEAQDAKQEMAVFGRVLDATRSNLAVMNRLRELRMGRLEYRDLPTPERWAKSENGHGDN